MNERATFETGQDRARERGVAGRLARAWGCTLVAAAPLAGYDYVARRGTVVAAVVEIKSRLNRSPDDYGGFLFLNVHKRDSLVDAARALGCRAAIFVWHFGEPVYWIDVLTMPGFPVERRGRGDRDGLDVRDAYRIHLTQLQPLGRTR
jgi:hypothetical protein